jgi:enoyl-CoA hydratase
MGAGVEIASCCDIRMWPVHRRALVRPLDAWAFRWRRARRNWWQRAAGELTAREMLLEARCWTRRLMLARGFLNRVVPMTPWPPRPWACARARRRAGAAGGAPEQTDTSGIKTAAIPITNASSDAMDNIVSGAYAYADSAEHREGIGAFLAKRRPDF